MKITKIASILFIILLMATSSYSEEKPKVSSETVNTLERLENEDVLSTIRSSTKPICILVQSMDEVASLFINAFGVEQSLVESGEIHPLTTIFLFRDVATGSRKIGLGDIAKILHFGEQFTSGQHGIKEELLC